MPSGLNLAERSLEPELMDAPDLTGAPLSRVLRDIERLNRASLADRPLWAPIARFARRAGRPIRVLDVASGGGYLALAIARRAQRSGLPIEVVGSDLSASSVELANERAAAERVDVRFEQIDVVNDELPGDVDVFTSTLFLHHLKREEAVRALTRMRDATRGLVLVNDLARSRTGYVLARVSTRVLSREPIVHFDGPRSVERAFTLREARALANDAGLDGARVTSAWPFRLMIEWHKS